MLSRSALSVRQLKLLVGFTTLRLCTSQGVGMVLGSTHLSTKFWRLNIILLPYPSILIECVCFSVSFLVQLGDRGTHLQFLQFVPDQGRTRLLASNVFVVHSGAVRHGAGDDAYGDQGGPQDW